MYLKLLMALSCLFSFSAYAQNEVDELFGDSFAIELDSYEGEDIRSELKDVLGRESSNSFDARGEQSGEWKISSNTVDVDKVSFKGQSRSLINWNTTHHSTWLDYGSWLKERELKDKHPDWKIQTRDIFNHELYGKVLKCIGSCKVYRGEKYVEAEYRSNIREGDELVLEENSYAWIYLMDGSLLRLSPLTSLSFNEINFSKESSFKYLRLNYGNLHLRPWQTFEIKKEELVESNLIMLPLMVEEANREFYAKESFKSKTDLERIEEHLKKLPGLDEQVKKLQELASVERKLAKNQRSFIVTSVGTIESQNQFIDLVYEFKGSAMIRSLDSLENQKMVNKDLVQESTIYFRGYNNLKKEKISSGNWYQMDSAGKNLAQDDSFQEKYNFNDMFTKRMYTIELARQLWIQKYTSFLKGESLEEKALAQDYGYRLWNSNELEKRLEFLREYTRRVETTNLGAMEKVFSKIGMQNFGESHYKLALKTQIQKLKDYYNKDHMTVKTMSDLDYYVWLLKNAN